MSQAQSVRGLLFVPLSLTVIHGVRPEESGVASSVLRSYHQALTAGFARGFLAAAVVAAVAVLVSVLAIRFRRDDLAGPQSQELS